MSAHVRRIEAVEKELKALSESSATKEDVSRVRAEMKKLYDGLHVGQCPHSAIFYARHSALQLVMKLTSTKCSVACFRIPGSPGTCMGNT